MNILITGGAGFFGRVYAHYLLEKPDTKRICIYSRDEWKQAQLRAELDDGHNRMRYFIGDVRDFDRLRRAMKGIDVVVHAAALKRIETAHYNPTELCKTNINGTMNAVLAAQDMDVSKFIFLSTDKACEPVSAYGYSKALCESIVLSANNTGGRDGTLFAVTRYGNVAGSTGSVIPIWKAMIRAGLKTVPVSDPDATRFWMCGPEAALMVDELIQTMRGGELKVPDLPAYRLGDLAEAMGVKMRVTGMGEYEKKHESMMPGESSDKAQRLTVEQLRDMVRLI